MEHEILNLPLNKTAQRYLKRVQDRVKYCITCQPYDDGDCVWILGEKVNLNDLFDELSIPERYKEDIAECLMCPNCGRSNFEIYEDVGLEDPYDRFTGNRIDKSRKKYERKLLKMQKSFEEYPSLGPMSPLGKRIMREIEKGIVPTIDISGVWFRAKNLKGKTDIQNINFDSSPGRKPKEGRYNHSGQNFLYLSDDKDTAIKEAVDDINKPETVCVREFNIDKVDRILDVKFEWNQIGDLESEIMIAIMCSGILDQQVENRESNLKPQYYITRFIADCSRRAGLNGISYISTRGYGQNVVLFYPEKVIRRPVNEVTILRWPGYINDLLGEKDQ